MIKNFKLDYKHHTSFLIAYSGGLDSTVLLHYLLELQAINKNLNIRAIHINHQLHSLSKKWSNFCENICKLNNISIVIKNILITHQNIESQARSKRYNILYQELLPNEILLTAHHLDDQCETFLLALKRGSGPRGLACMPYEKYISNTQSHIRPLLNVSKSSLRKWAIAKNIYWIDDFSNFDLCYDRNFIRNSIIPKLVKRWPSFINCCARSAYLCNEQETLITQLIKKKIIKTILKDGSLYIRQFLKNSKETQNLLLRHWFFLKHKTMPSKKLIDIIINEVINTKKDANPQVNFRKYIIKKYKNKLYWINNYPSLKNTILFWNNINTSLILPNKLGQIAQNKYGILLPKPKNDDIINIRFNIEGKYLIFGKLKRKKIKKIWQELKIPTWNRNNIPLLFYNNTLISALGVFTIQYSTYDNNNLWKLCWNNKII